jgi:hypothetical protein
MKNTLSDSRRGYIFTNDFMVAAALYVTALAFMVSAVELSHASEADLEYARQLQDIADRASLMLSETEGNPPEWNTQLDEPILSLGIGDASRELSKEKINALKRMAWEDVNDALGLESARGYIVGDDIGGRLFSVGPGCWGEYTVESARLARYNNRTARIVVRLCRGEDTI